MVPGGGLVQEKVCGCGGMWLMVCRLGEGERDGERGYLHVEHNNTEGMRLLVSLLHGNVSIKNCAKQNVQLQASTYVGLNLLTLT